MESQFSVDYSSPSNSQENREASKSVDGHVPPPYWQFVSDFKQKMGEDAQPDALFFVESWMLGASAAIENLKYRRASQSDQSHARNEFSSETNVSATAGAQSISSESFSSDSFIKERQRQAQFCTSHYAVPPASPAEPIAARAHRKFQDKPESVANDFDTSDPSNQPMTRLRAFQVLGVAASSTRTQIKSAFRRLVNEWHPDRFEWRTERARQVATEKMSVINKAYQLLRTGI
jgi:DnaJ-domain-containing protein 1